MSDWLRSVAEVLPLARRAVAPYTLGEAVAEIGAYAQVVADAKWISHPTKKTRASLRAEIDAQSERLGERLRVLIAPLLDNLRDCSDRELVVIAADQLGNAWRSEAAIKAAFQDLCDAAKVPSTTSRALRTLSGIIASQIGPAAHGAFSLLSQAADALVGTEERLERRWGEGLTEHLTEAQRLKSANDILIAPPAGQLTVWLVYYRAIISGMRVAAGPITFLRADWALPNAFDVESQDFPERAELRAIRDRVHWLEELRVESMKMENRLVLVRVELGERQVAGAVDEARRRVDAMLSVAVEAGGVSWQSAGASSILVDGKIRGSSFGLILRGAAEIDESYGMGITAELLTNAAEQLGDALAKHPMPEQLIEALSSLREARMTDHRDVIFYNARRVTPRVATALEDHAMELIASALDVAPEDLALALQRRESLIQCDRLVAGELVAPFAGAWSLEQHEGRRELERKILDYGDGRPAVSVAKSVALQSEIRALPMSALERADLEDALAVCTDPEREKQLLEATWGEETILRGRHRRVRNAVNHGLPLDETTLNSVRVYADETSSTALNIALTWFKSGEPGSVLLEREERAWTSRMNRISRGVSWVIADERYTNGLSD